MTWGSYSSYLVIVILIVLAPGPDTMVMLKNALSGGSRCGFLATAGIFVSNSIQGTAAALGLGVVIAQSQPVFVRLKWVGAAYLVFLGFQALRGAWRGDYSGADAVNHRRASGWRSFREGFLSNITNPKVLVLYLSVLPQFLDPVTTSTWHALQLAYPVAVLGFVWQMALLFFVHRVRAWLKRRKVRRALDGVTGTALVGFGAALVFES